MLQWKNMSKFPAKTGELKPLNRQMQGLTGQREGNPTTLLSHLLPLPAEATGWAKPGLEFGLSPTVGLEAGTGAVTARDGGWDWQLPLVGLGCSWTPVGHLRQWGLSLSGWCLQAVCGCAVYLLVALWKKKKNICKIPLCLQNISNNCFGWSLWNSALWLRGWHECSEFLKKL